MRDILVLGGAVAFFTAVPPGVLLYHIHGTLHELLPQKLARFLFGLLFEFVKFVFTMELILLAASAAVIVLVCVFYTGRWIIRRFV